MMHKLMKIDCPECGDEDGWDVGNGVAECSECGTPCPVLFSTGHYVGKIFDGGGDGLRVESLNRSFTSHKQLEAYCASRGLELHGHDSSVRRDMINENRSELDKECKAAGFENVRKRREFFNNAPRAEINEFVQHRQAERAKDTAKSPLKIHSGGT